MVGGGESGTVLLVGKMRASAPLWETVPGKEDGFELRQRKREPG